MPPTTTLRIHQLVLRDKYRVERLLGSGATAEVYEVSRPDGRGKRAPKVMRLMAGSVPADLEAQRQRFSWEYDLGQDFMSHPRIVHSLDFELEGELPVLVMEFMPGGSLRAELDAADGRRLAWMRCAEVLRDVSEGLGALHAAGLVHRDVKPSNVLLEANRRARIGDLGVVQTSNTVTRTDGIGHPHPHAPGYASPEHANAQASLSPAADVYGVGAMGFEMLTGRLPQPAAVAQAPPEIGGDAPAWMKGLIQRMLAHDHRVRPQDGGAVAEWIRRDLQADHERVSQQSVRIAELSRKIDAALAAQPLTKTEMDEADRQLAELRFLAPTDPGVVDLYIRLLRAIREAPESSTTQLPLTSKGTSGRRERLRREAELREDLELARGRKQWEDVVRISEELLELEPSDIEATSNLKAASRELVRRDRDIAEARESLRIRVADGAWDDVEASAQAVLALVAGDAEAVEALADLEAELERRWVAALGKMEEEARAALRAATANRAWDDVAAAAVAILAFAPADREAQAAQAVSEARSALRAALNVADWDSVTERAKALLGLAPDDAEALQARAKAGVEVAQRRILAEKMSAVEADRATLSRALQAQDLDQIDRVATDLLRLLPGDTEALRAQAGVRAELKRRKAAAVRKRAAKSARSRRDRATSSPVAIAEARATLQESLASRAWDSVDGAAKALLALVPGDDEALRAQLRLARELKRRLIVAEKKRAEDTARAKLRKQLGTQSWVGVADAARSLLNVAPSDAEALKAEADARLHLEFKTRLSRISQDRLELAIALGIQMEFVRVPAGGSAMGNSKPVPGVVQRIMRALTREALDLVADQFATASELPWHSQHLTEFWIGTTPVTVAQYAIFAESAGAKTGANLNVPNKLSHPVVRVTWFDCIAFCAWASNLGCGEVTLASEAEWEKAARGTDGRTYPWGNEAPDDTRLNYNQNVKDTTPVGLYGVKGQSPYGCYDMAGNVWEWTRSLWGRELEKPEFGYPYTSRQADREDIQAGTDVFRVLRGGSFNSDAGLSRCAFRTGYDPGGSVDDLGFRVVLRPPPFG